MPEVETPIVEPVASNWYPDEYKDVVSQKGWDASGFLKSYTELEKALSVRVKIPTEESTPEEKSSFFTRLGRPDTSDGYTRPELPEGKDYDKDLIGGMQTAAFEEGITQKQFSKLVERYLAIQGKKAEDDEVSDTQAVEEHDRVLKELWHVNYDANMEIARRGLRELVAGDLGEKFQKLIKDKGLEYDSVLLQAFHEMGSKILDDTLITSDGAPPKLDDDYVPSSPNSPEMYRNAEDDEGKKARAYFEKKGFRY